MNKSCARCSKVVYPIEELKCLDKTWHKTCFKCHECSMTLNMKTYKGFDKLPYCEAHIPKAKATTIADTPELKRIAENTKIQSNVMYHADFEKAKGKFTQVADDPETLRIKQNTKIISNVAYHGDLAKKAAMEKQRESSEVVDTRDNESEYFSETLAAEQFLQYAPQQLQPQIPSPTFNNNNIKQHQEQYQPTQQPQHHQPQQISPQTQHYQPQPQNIKTNNTTGGGGGGGGPAAPSYNQPPQQIYQQPSPTKQKYHQPTSQNYQQPHYQQPQTYHHHHNQPPQTQQQRSAALQSSHIPSGSVNQTQSQENNYYDQYETYARPKSNAPINMYNHNNNNNSALAYQQPQQLYYNNGGGGGVGGGNDIVSSMAALGIGNTNGGVVNGGGNIGKIADYDPLTDGPRNVPNTTRQSTTLIYSSSDRGTPSAVNNSSVYPKRVGSIADIDPANGHYGSLSEQQKQLQQQQQYYHQQQQQQQMHQSNQMRQNHSHQHHQQQQQQQSQQQHYHQHQQPPQQLKQSSRLYRAIYDYEAQDTDEVSFREGDLIEVESIDSGWMTGKVDRTGTSGMLPANYVEPAVI